MSQPTTSTEYLAAFEPLSGQTEDDYISHVVYFRPGHDVEQHFKAIGRRWDLISQTVAYYKTLSADELQLVRQDHGVSKVKEYTDKMSAGLQRSIRAPIIYDYSSRWEQAPGWIVAFDADETYSLEEHFTIIGQRIDGIQSPDKFSGIFYAVETLSDAQMAAIFTDSHVETITQNARCSFN